MPSGVNETRRESFVNWHLFETEGVQARCKQAARVLSSGAKVILRKEQSGFG
jgi:hypothetical protein